MHYNFIGHQEDFQDDVTSLLNIFTNNTASNYVDEHFGPRNVYAKESTEDWYNDIPCDVMKIIFNLYKDDYTAFNYSIPSWLLDKVSECPDRPRSPKTLEHSVFPGQNGAPSLST